MKSRVDEEEERRRLIQEIAAQHRPAVQALFEQQLRNLGIQDRIKYIITYMYSSASTVFILVKSSMRYQKGSAADLQEGLYKAENLCVYKADTYVLIRPQSSRFGCGLRPLTPKL